MDAEVVKQFFLEHLPTIINYGLMFIAYILVFIFRGKVSKTRTSMTILYKDENKKIRAEVIAARNELQKSVNDAIAKQQIAEEKLAQAELKLIEVRETYEKRIKRLENTITAFLGGKVYGDQDKSIHTDGGNTTSSVENLGGGTSVGDIQEVREEGQGEPVQ